MITAEEFMKANDESLVVSGSTIYKKGMPRRPGNVWGGRYRLADGRVFALKAEEGRKLPEGYPKWLL